MWILKWLSILFFFVMVTSGLLFIVPPIAFLGKMCVVSAGLYVSCGYAKHILQLWPSSKKAEKLLDRTADILEEALKARQVALIHHLDHEHHGVLKTHLALELKGYDKNNGTLHGGGR